MDSISDARLQLVCPALAAKVRQLAMMMDLAGEPIEVVQGLRLWADQQKLWDQGRTTPGAIVTNAPPGHSWHEFAMAADCCPVSLIGTPNWSPESPVWLDYGKKAVSLGLFWGGDFVHTEPDRPHVQLTGAFPVSPDDDARYIMLTTNNVSEVWKAAGLTEEV